MENNHRIIIFIADYYKDRTKKEKKGKHVEVTEFNNFFFQPLLFPLSFAIRLLTHKACCLANLSEGANKGNNRPFDGKEKQMLK